MILKKKVVETKDLKLCSQTAKVEDMANIKKD